MKKKPLPPAKGPAQQPAQGGQLDIEAIIKDVRAKLPPQLQAMFDKVVLSGERIMFDKSSHKMMLDQLNQPGPLTKRISDGIITLIYMLWTRSNRTIPPQLIVPATVVLTLRAFQFLQESKDPEATKEVLGEALADAVQGVMDRFGATQDKLPGLLKGQAGAPAGAAGQPGAPAQPDPDGLLAAASGGQA
jgi:hypothetical protein